VRNFQQTQVVDVAARGTIDYSSIVSVGGVIPQDADWRSLVH